MASVTNQIMGPSPLSPQTNDNSIQAWSAKNGISQFQPPSYNEPSYLSNLKGMASGITPDTSTYQAKDYTNADLPQFDVMRQQTEEGLNQTNSANQDALQRRFSAMGNANSGAYIKAAQIQDQQAQQTKANAVNQIGAQEAQEKTSLQQQEEQKAFQSQEAEKSRAQQAQEFGFDAHSKIAGLEQQSNQFQTQTAEDVFNSQMEQYKAQHANDSWFCTEAQKEEEFSNLEKRALRKFRSFSSKKDKDLHRFYIKECKDLVSRIPGSAFKKFNFVFVKSILENVFEGDLEGAYRRYVSYVTTLIDFYWKECTHPQYLKLSQIPRFSFPLPQESPYSLCQ